MRAWQLVLVVVFCGLGGTVGTADAQPIYTRVFSADPASLGGIPQPASCLDLSGPTRDITFSVSGLPGVVQQVLLENVHIESWDLGSLIVQLIAPNGATHELFGLTGATTEGVSGGPGRLAGFYTFADIATGNWWLSAAALGETGFMPMGSYRTSVRGGTPSSGVVTSMDAAFARISPNGVWTLRFRDTCNVRDASASHVSQAVLTLTTNNQPQVPTGLVASQVIGNAVTLRWNPPTTGPTPIEYVLEGGVQPGEVLATLPTGTAAPVFQFIAPTGSFLVRVHAQTEAGRSGPSNEIRLFVNVPEPPSDPVGLLGAVNGSSVALSWRNTYFGGPPESIVLDVGGSLTASIPLGPVEEIAVDNVPVGTYQLRVRAVNGRGASGSSNPVTLTVGSVPTPPCSGSPETPVDFIAYKSGATLHLAWDPAAAGAAVTGFVVHATGTVTADVHTTARALSAGVGGGTYRLSVTATNMCGASAPTAVQVVTIP